MKKAAAGIIHAALCVCAVFLSGATYATVYTDALDGEFPNQIAAVLCGCRFTVESLCRRITDLPLEKAVASDLCDLIATQDI